MKQLALLAAIVTGLTLALACSFNPLGKQKITVFPAAWRSGPPIGSMSHYALMVSGNLSNSLRNADVGNRSVGCLGFGGAVNFPYTYAQVVSGISLALAPGTYTFKFVGFSDSAVTSPATVGQLFAGSPSLKAYVLAQVSATVSPGGQVKTTSTYDAPTAADVIAACPPLSQALHALLRFEDHIEYLTNGSGSWNGQSIQVIYTSSEAHLFVDDQGKAHVSYGDSGARYGVRYSTNQSGSFVDELAITSSVTGGYDHSDVTVGADGTRHLLHNYGNVQNEFGLSLNLGVNWLYQGPMTSAPNYYDNFRLATTAGGKLVGAGREANGVAGSLVVSTRDSGAWGPPNTISAVGGDPCANYIGGAAVQFDPVGRAHVVFVCRSGTTLYIGYTNEFIGNWQATAIQAVSLSFAMIPPSFSIDAQGTMHLTYALDNDEIYYLQGNSVTGNWQGGTLVNTGGLPIQALNIVGISTTDAKIVAVESLGSNAPEFVLYNYDGDHWARSLIYSSVDPMWLGEGLFFK